MITKHLLGSIIKNKNSKILVSGCSFYRENYDFENEELCELCIVYNDTTKDRKEYTDAEVIHILKNIISDPLESNSNLLTKISTNNASLCSEISELKKQNKSYEKRINDFNGLKWWKKITKLV